MKAVDITLLFQALNFFIVYFVLRRYVFYPAMHILMKNDKEQKSLMMSIAKATDQKKQIEQTKYNKWLYIKKSLHVLIPHISTKWLSSGVSVDYKKLAYDDKAELSDQQKQKMKKVICDELMDVKS